MKAQNLRIRMMQAAETRIDMTFAASVTELLPLLLPLSLRQKLDRRSIHLPAIATEAKERGYTPGELFRFEEDAQVVRAWLE